jgi:putative acetyltransferase
MAVTKSVIIKPVTGDEANHLLRQSDDYMASLYPAESNHLVDSSALRGKGARFIGAFLDDVCAGCVGVRFFQDSPPYGEIKRLYVDPAYRGKAIASKLMAEIEQVTIAEGVAMVRLETGVLQKAAIGLYESLGYCHIQPFGSYLDDPLSLFMEKHLVPSAPA